MAQPHASLRPAPYPDNNALTRLPFYLLAGARARPGSGWQPRGTYAHCRLPPAWFRTLVGSHANCRGRTGSPMTVRYPSPRKCQATTGYWLQAPVRRHYGRLAQAVLHARLRLCTANAYSFSAAITHRVEPPAFAEDIDWWTRNACLNPRPHSKRYCQLSCDPR